MEVRSFSKSGYQAFRICPWRADQIRNKGVKAKPSKAALDGREVHWLWHNMLIGKLTREEASAKASNEDVLEQFANTLLFDVDFSGKRYHEHRIALNGLSCRSEVILDFGYTNDRTTWIYDLKTGRDESVDPVETDVSALAARQVWPAYSQTLFFRYLFTRTQHTITCAYRRPQPNHVIMTSINNVRRDLISTDGRDPLLAKVQSYIDEMRNTPPIPTPGPHCESMFGEPCQFLGTGCPLEPDARQTFNAPMPVPEQELIAANIMRLPEDKRPGAAFMLIKDGYPIDLLSPNLVSYAYQGVMQLRQGARNVADAIRSWSKTGRTFSVGKTEYGWRPQRITDVELAIRLLLENKVPSEDLAKVLSASKSGLEKLSKRKYGQLGTQIADACVYDAADKEFGKL